MLESLHIRNFAIIEDVTLELGSGLNILSGETGAGKSIVIQALGLLMGERGNSDWIRKGEEAAVVTGLFDISDQTDLLQKLSEWGSPLEDPELLVQRTLSRNGRNQVRLNAMPATVTMLGALAESLVDIVSQREHERLLRPDMQRELLDRFGGCDDLLSEYRDTLETARGLKKELEVLELSVEENREMEEFLRFQLREIREANLQSGEDGRLRTEKGRIKNASQLGELCATADDILVSGSDTISGRLAKLENQLARVGEADPDLAKLLPVLQSIQVQLDDCAQTFSNSLLGLEFEPGRLETIESRLAEIDQLKKKIWRFDRSRLGTCRGSRYKT